jgi:hypothetical protein
MDPLHDVVVGYDESGPQRIHQFFPGDEPTSVLGQ